MTAKSLARVWIECQGEVAESAFAAIVRNEFIPQKRDVCNKLDINKNIGTYTQYKYFDFCICNKEH